MKKISILVGCVALAVVAGCRDEQGEGPMKPGIYSVVGSEGMRTVFMQDGTYSDMMENQPQPTAQGKWWRKDGKLCLQPDTSDQELCSDETAVGADGSFRLEANGMSIEFKALAN